MLILMIEPDLCAWRGSTFRLGMRDDVVGEQFWAVRDAMGRRTCFTEQICIAAAACVTPMLMSAEQQQCISSLPHYAPQSASIALPGLTTSDSKGRQIGRPDSDNRVSD